STIAADALQAGNGGKIIVWADNTTRFLGGITARGAGQVLGDRFEVLGFNPALSPLTPNISNGGFVEVSGKQTLLFRGQVDTSAPLGRHGTLLLDPDEITIAPGALGTLTELSSNNFWGAGFSEPLENPGSQTIGTNDLRSLLLLNDVTLEASGNITWVTGAILDYNGINANRTLNLVAGNSITISGTITDTVVGGESLNLVLNADRDIDGIGTISLSGANIITSGGNIVLGGGIDPLLNPAIGVGSRGISITTSNLDAGGGNISLRGQSNNFIGVLVQNSTLRTGASGTIAVTGTTIAGGDGINTSSGLITTGAGDITLLGTAPSGGTGINLGAANTTTGNITANGIGQGGWGIVVNGPVLSTSGNISLRGTNSGSFEGIRVNQPITTTTGTIDLNGTSSGSGVWVVDAGRITSSGGQISVTGSNTSIGGRHGVIIDATSSGVNSNGGSIFLSGTSVASSTDIALNQTVSAGSGNIVLTGDRLAISRPLTGFGLGIQPRTSSLDVEIGSNSTFLSSASIAAINTSKVRIGGLVPFGTVTLRTDANFSAITEIDNVDTLVGPNRFTQWTLTGLGSGEISGFPARLSFTNVGNIVGGSLGDRFGFQDGASVPGTINGGAGFDILDYTNYNAPFSVNLALGLATGTISIISIEDFIPKGSSPTVPGGNSSGGSSSNPPPNPPDGIPDFVDDFQADELDDIEGLDSLLDDLFADISLDVDLANIQDLPATDLDLLEIDSDFAADFADYLSASASDFATDVDAAATLRRVNQETGINSAFVFINFVPSAASSPTARAKSGQSKRRATWSSRPQSDRDELELLVATADGKYVRRRLQGVTRKQVIATADRLRVAITEPGSDEYRKPAQALYQWLIAPLEPTLKAKDIRHLSLLLAPGLRSVPLAVLHDGKQFMIEKYSVGLMPSLAMTDTTYEDLRDAQVLAMGASRFVEQNPLPAVPEELRLIADDLWPGEAYLNEAFTLVNLKSRHRQGNFRIIHLATHGDFKAGDLSQSYIQFWDTRLRLNQIRELSLNNPKVDLLVLSACRTALGNEQAELGFAGLAFQAGVRSVLGSLWYVSDEGTLALMKEFYSQLQVVPIKAEALRQAQLALIQGKVVIQDGQLRSRSRVIPLPPELVRNEAVNLKHPYYWAAFTLVGNPW
ncbi:MAG: CHAT domain-containing protein, partial [Cyanobacteria bacterium]|nr:CHAT domain-containing protein [Cyanobacteriota bacterium]MDW8201376.1 CHAT domain-containing protein [Cyanobacteriota bacterium SKYGB_h_bin112]